MSSLLQVDKLTAGFGMTPVLFEVDLELAAGELVALIGANGAGKSTLLGALSGLVRVSSGTVHLAGRRLTGLRPEMIVANGMVHVPQGRRLFSTMTVERNLLLGAYRRQARAGIARNLDFCFEAFPVLRARRRQLAGSMSGGEQQMLAVARALMSSPRILLVDEPSVGLAPILVSRVIAKIKELKEQHHLTVLMAEQNFNQATKIADRGYIIVHGKIEFEGRSTRELRENELVKKYYLGV